MLARMVGPVKASSQILAVFYPEGVSDVRSPVLVLAVLGLALQARSADAQATQAAPAAYSRSAKDTLRFHEVTHTEIRMTTPQGEFTIPADHDARISVVFLPGDSARAWYDSLRVSLNSPAGLMAPETGSLLKQPFALKLDNRGRTTLTSAPKFPEALQGVTDLSHQFDDFFLRLPAQPLKIGLMWTDTVSRTDSTGGKWIQITTIGQFRVERDTTVAGQAAMVISAKQRQMLNSEAPVPGQDLRAQSTLTGNDDGFFLFAPKTGRMLGRQRKGELTGQMVMSGAAGSMTIGQTMTFTNRIDLVK